METELTRCPACGRPAEILDRFVVFGDRGPIEHVRIRCISGPSFERCVGRWNPGASPPSPIATYQDSDPGL
jgi:hypothetical protein